MLDLNMQGLNSSIAILNESCGLSAPPEPRLAVGKSMPQPKMRLFPAVLSHPWSAGIVAVVLLGTVQNCRVLPGVSCRHWFRCRAERLHSDP